MAKYRNASLLDQEEKDLEEIKELEDRIKEENELKEIEEKVVETKEEETFKKRYADLRRHASQTEGNLKLRIDELEKQLKESSQQQFALPKTEEELEAFTKKYPDVVAIMEVIAAKRFSRDSEEVKSKMQNLEEEAARLKRQNAYAKLLELHPDFDDLRSNPDFIDWVDTYRNEWVRQAMRGFDPYAAADAINLYKQLNGLDKTEKKDDKAEEKRKAAETVKSKSNPDLTKKEDGFDFSESQIERETQKNPKWFEKNEEAIMESIRKGRFKYDLSQTH